MILRSFSLEFWIVIYLTEEEEKSVQQGRTFMVLDVQSWARKVHILELN